MNSLVKFFGVVVAAGALMSCGGGGAGSVTAPPGGGGSGGGACTADFCMLAASFSPTTVTVARGATVSWTNNSGVTHDVTFDTPGSVTGGNIPAFRSGTQTRAFPTSGSYHFICSIHGSTMTGTVTVQ